MRKYMYTQERKDFGTHFGPITYIDVYRVKTIYLGRAHVADGDWKGSKSEAACIIHAKEEGHRWKKRDHSLCDVQINLI